MFELVSHPMFTQTHDTMKPHNQLRHAQLPPAKREGNASPPILLNELIVEILSRAPVKSLLRFKCVCKWWKSMIFDPQFVKLHLHRSAANADFSHLRLTEKPLCFNFDDERIITCSIRSLLDNPYCISPYCVTRHFRLRNKYLFVGSCNGLFCMAGYDYVQGGIQEYWVQLWNPATRLRSEKSPCFCMDWPSIRDRFDFTMFGFGYDHLTDTFKVVVVFCDHSAKEDSQKTLVKAYSMGDNCWRNIQSFPAVPRQNDGEFLSGTLNWVAIRNCSSGYEWSTITIDQLLIVSLDLGKETYRQLLLPHGFDEVPHVEPTLGVLRDCLCVSHDYKKTHFVVWQMKEFGVEKSWTQLVNVSYEYLQTRCLEFPSSLLPLCMSENGDVLMLSYSDEPRAILYNQRDNKLELHKIPKKINSMHPRVYVESLVPPCRN